MRNKLILWVTGILILSSFVFAQSVIWGNEAKVEFEIAGSIPICDQETFNWKQWVNEELEEWSSLTNCYQSNGIPKICCPGGQVCKYEDPNDDDYMKCVPVAFTLDYCEDYTLDRFGSAEVTENECNSASLEIAARSVRRTGAFPDGICGNYYISINGSCVRDPDCICSWNGSSCNPAVEYSDWICYDYINDEEEKVIGDGICALERNSVEGNCETDSFLRMIWERVWYGEESDKPIECDTENSVIKLFPCPASLAFFTLFSFFITLSIIIIIYFLLHFRKKRK